MKIWTNLLVLVWIAAAGNVAIADGDVKVITTIEGDKGPGFKAAANVMGAVGPQHVVNFTIAGFTVHHKSTGKILRHESQLEFWHQVQPIKSLDPSPHANDPWMVYDPLTERWFATIAGTGTGESYLAVSTSADPLQPWKGVSLPLPRVDPGLKIGVDRNGVYISCANGSENPREALDIYVIPKADAIDTNGPSLERARTVGKLIYAAFPAVHVEADQRPETPAVLINNEFGGPTCAELYLNRITWTGTRADISTAQTIPLSRAYAVPRMEGMQPDGGVKLLQAGGRRNNCAFVHGGSVFSCNGAQRTADSRPGILWYEVRIEDGALLQEGFVDSPDCDFLYPSIAVDRRGNIGIGCTRTSEKEYPSVCVMMHAAGDPAGSMRPPAVAVKGTTAFRYSGVPGMNFSNYSTTCIDPTDDQLLWTYQGYANSGVDRQWCTAWAAFKMAVATHAADHGEESPQSIVTASDTFIGSAARSGTYRRPLLDVNGKRYELEPSDHADKSVEDLLKKFSEGDTGRYAIQGTRGTVKGNDGIVIESITPATTAAKNAAPTATTTAPADTPLDETSTKSDVAESVVTVGGDRYTVYDYDDLTTRNYSVVIPEGLQTVRGLLVHGCYAGGDSRYDWKTCEYYRQFMHLHGFAYVGSTGTAGSPNSPLPSADTSAKARHRAIYDAFVKSLPVIASASRHPELVNAPFAGVGFSAGGGYSLNLMAFAPEKTIAAVSYCAPFIFKRRISPPVSNAVLSVPSICITGEEEGFNIPLAPDVDPSTGPARIDEVFVPYRPKGAEYAWLERQGQGHEYFENRQDVLGMPFLDAAVRARYPKDGDVTKGPIKLIDIDHATGWIADNTTWKSGLTKIAPAGEFKGDLGHSSWLQNEDLAFIYRAYATYDNPLTITSPSPCGPGTEAIDPGSDVIVMVDAGRFPTWKKLEFYDGARKLGTVTEAPAQFTATKLTVGYHVFSVLGTDAEGTMRTSDPVMVVVRAAVVP